MSTLTTSMLRSLLPTQAPSVGVSPGVQSGPGALNFASMLNAAKAGQLTSDRPVEAAPEVQGQLTPEQLSRIGVAADNAESAGMNNALVMIDGKAVKLDVLTRQVTAVMDPRTAAVTDIDGVIAAPPSSLYGQVAGDATGVSDPTSIAGVLGQQLLSRLGSRGAVGLTNSSSLQPANLH